MIDLTGKHYNTRDTIQTIFSPLIGVITSPLADEICRRNCVNFVELLQPFAKLQSDAHFRDIVSGTSVSVRGLHLNFCDVNWRPPQTALARKMLNDSVANATSCDIKTINVDAVQLQIPKSELWFESWREIFLTVQFPAEHEFTRHFLGCLIVLSSDDPDLVKTAQKITMEVHQMQNIIPQNLPKWFQASNPLNSYVILHETRKGDLSRAQQGYELLKSTFGDNKCFLIQMNSIGDADLSEIPDYWAQYMNKTNKLISQSDATDAAKSFHDNIRVPLLESNSNEAAVGMKSIFIEGDDSKLHPLSPVEEHKSEVKPLSAEFLKDDNSLTSLESQTRPGEPEISHGRSLNSTDVENIRHFVQDYAVRALIPYVENLVAILSEAVTNKKGVSKSLLSATKRWFITNKPGTTNVSNQNAVIYTQESVELQTRKLGDLYFMFGHYNLAFQAYHQAKRDFNADSAWQYYAGALEMAALSAFMLGTANRKTYDYMEDAIVCYLNVCKLQQFATRATLLSVECLKVAKLYTEAAKQLTRMTSEESDLRSALLLEQAAYCFLATQPIMYRKYAFHIVLAGNRFTRSGQRKHAYRCYRQAYQIFKEKSWSLADDHIQYTMAKQAMILRNPEDAIHSLSYLLRPGSLQNAQQQINFLREYVQTQNEILKLNPQPTLLHHAVPKILQESIRVLILPYSPTSNAPHVPATHISIDYNFEDETIWRKLEEMVVFSANSDKPIVFKSQQNIFTREHPAADNPLAVQNEPIVVAVTLQNPLRCKISLNNVDLLWKLRLDNEEEISNVCIYDNSNTSTPEAAITAVVKSNSQSVVLDELSEKSLVFHLTPKVVGSLELLGIVCQVSTTTEPSVSLVGMLEFEKRTIKTTTKQAAEVIPDKMLSLNVLPLLPSLNVSFSATPKEVFVGEIIPVTVSLWNSGIAPIEDIYVACDNPRWITWLDKETEVPLSILGTLRDISNLKITKDKEIRRQRVFRLMKSRAENALKPQESITLPMWIQAPFQSGPFTLRILFYYGLPGECKSKLKYRLIRHTWSFNVNEGLITGAVSFESYNDFSLDLSVKNDIRPSASAEEQKVADLYVNTLGLYSSHHKLIPGETYFTNEMELREGALGQRCMGPSKRTNLHCCLQNIEIKSSPENAQNCLRERLTYETLTTLSNLPKIQHMAPPLDEMYSFLAKNETLFFDQNLSSEDFNAALSKVEPHITVVFLWVAQIKDASNSRIAWGQHFIQLHDLFVESTCPITNTPNHPLPSTNSGEPEEANPNIIEYSKQLSLEDNKFSEYDTLVLEENDGETNQCDDDNDGFPKDNIVYVGRRCLIEDPNFPNTTKTN